MPRFHVPGRADRRWAIAALALANVLWLIGAFVPAFLWGPMRPLWMMFFVGCVLGHEIFLALWFALSRDTLWFRLAMMVAVVAAFGLDVTLLGVYRSLYIFSQRNSREPQMAGWLELAGIFVLDWLSGVAFLAALMLLAYALVLPIRRLSGTCLATAEADGEPGRPDRRFRLQEAMIWTALVAAPLGLVRLSLSMGVQDESNSAPVNYIALAFLLVPVIVGWPLFRAVLAQRYAVLWTIAAVALLSAAGAAVSEVVFWFERTNSGSGLGQILGFWPLQTILWSTALVLCGNTLFLRWLGFRIRYEPCGAAAR